jgi:hypothetical protein
MQLSLGRLQEMSTDTKSQIRGAGFDINADGQTSAQVFTKASLSEALSMLNTEVSGRALFGGRAVEGNAVIGADVLIDGDGAGKAGYKQVMQERIAADSGADGRGRTVISPQAADTVRLAEDGSHPFGLKLSEVTSTSASVILTTNLAVPRQSDVQFTSVPNTGDTVRFSFELPDGTIKSFDLTATANGTEENSFAFGSTPAEASANFQVALEAAVEKTVATSMSAASSMKAADDFFDSPPKRLNNTAAPETATGYEAGDTTLNTVVWYTGDSDSSVSNRDTAQAYIGRNRKVSYGARADEAPFKAMLKSLTVMSATSFSDTALEKDRYQEISTRVTAGLSFTNGQTSINSIIAEVASLQSYVGQSQEFNQAEMNLADELIAGRVSSDINEVAVRLSAIQVHLQAAYSATSIVSKLSLTNYI